MDHEGGLIRATQLSGYASLVKHYGEDPERLLHLARLPNIYLHEPQLYMPFELFVVLMDVTARELGQPFFGAELGNEQGLRILGPAAYGASSSVTVGEALDFLRGYQSQQTTGATIHFERARGLAKLSNEITEPMPCDTRQTAEHTVAVGIRMMKTFHGESWMPHEVFFQHDAPCGLAGGYRALFGDAILFAAERSGFSFDVGMLEAPLPAADPIAHRTLLRQQRLAILPVPETFAHRVESTIRVTMPNGELSLGSTARMLSVSPRTLQRRLTREGTSFARLVDHTRRQLAEQYLRNCEELQLSQVSELLGFTQLSNLSHAFRRWHGMSPSEWKKQHPDAAGME